jgi:uncharacterized membrane protein YgcG
MKVLLAAVLAAFLTCATSAALADDWVAIKLRGGVLQLVEGDWEPLERGAVVSDDRPIRTMQNGRVTFKRDAETIEVGPQSAIQIADRSGHRYTTVTQHFGKVTVEAEVQNVEHFSVKTPHLAAVVKGTKFVVVSGKSSAEVTVARGHVAVEDQHNHQTVTVSAGQSAATEVGQPMEVAGRGELPAVLDAKGEPVDEVAAAATAAGAEAAAADANDSDQGQASSAKGAGNGNSGNGNGNSGGNSGSGNSGNGNSGNGNSGNGNSNSSSNSGNSGGGNSNGNGGGNGNSGSGNSGNGNGNGGGNGNGNGNDGVVSTVVGGVGGIVGGLL